MLRRGSTAVNVDDRGHPYPAVAAHSQSSFSSPEGEYLLTYEVSPPVPVTPATPGGTATTPAAAAAAAAALASSTNEYPASLSIAVITFPAASTSSSSGLLGLGGNSQRGTRSRDASTTQVQELYSSSTPGPSNLSSSILAVNGQAQDDQASSSHSGSSYDNAGQANSNSAPGHSPASSRRRPLMSLPSMTSMPLPSLGSNNNNGSAPATSTSKPKSAFRGTSSNFVKSYEGLPFSGRADKIWQSQEAREVILAISTGPKATLIWDISPRAKFRDPVAKLAFSAAPTCTAVNQATLSHERMDLLIGFQTGDIIWVEVFSGRYTRYNKDPSTLNPQSGSKQTVATYVSTSPVKKLQWLQGDQLFASAFQDGCIAFWDKDKEDPSGFAPTAGLAPSAGPVGRSERLNLSRVDTGGESTQEFTSDEGHLSSYLSGSRPVGDRQPRRHGSHMPPPPEEYTEDIVVTVAPPQVDKKSNSNKYNPIAHWKVSRKAITDFAMSPDDQYCAVTSEDGCLRIIDCSSQRLLDTFQGYFGALTCVNWSPDGRFVLTGGQDDLACVWSPFEQRIVARCEGHSSFLTDLSFDPWRCDSRTQRFASVSEDCKLILWDLSSAALQRPKGHHQHGHQTMHHRRQSAAMSSLSLSRRKTIESSGNLPSTGMVERENPLWHHAAPRGEVPGLQPVTVKQISNDLLASIAFLPNMVVTISRGGTIKVFVRPDYRP